MESIRSLMSLAVFMTPIDKLIEIVHSDSTNYLAATTDESKEEYKRKLSISIQMVMEKMILGDSSNPEDLVKHMDNMENSIKSMNLLNPEVN